MALRPANNRYELQPRNERGFAQIGDEKLSKKMAATRLPESYMAVLETLGDGKNEWLRKVICDAIASELMPQDVAE